METNRKRILNVFRRRLFKALFWKSVLILTSIVFFTLGVAVLALRVGGWEKWDDLLYGLVALACIPLLAWLGTSRRIPDERTLASILDRNNNVGGLLMSSYETDLGDWVERIGTLEIPVVRWSPYRRLGFVAASVAFAVTALLFPLAAISGSHSHRLNVDDQVKRLTTQLDVMKEENLLDVEEVESRKMELDKIQKEADGMGPVKTFDALDHIADRMNQKAAEAVENAQKTTETLAEAAALAQQVKDVSGELDEASRKSLMDGLAKSLEDMLAANEEMAEALKKTLKKALEKQAEKEKKEQGSEDGQSGENGTAKKDALTEALKKMLDENNMQGLTPEMLQQLGDAMKQCQGDTERMCENLQNAGFPIDKEMLEKLAKSREVEKEEAERMLSDLWANCDDCDGKQGDCEGERSKEKFSPRYTKKQDWTTDPNEGPADTNFEKEPDEEGAEFKAQFLPPSDLEAFRKSRKIGASIQAPELDPNAKPDVHGGAIQDTGGGIGAAHGQLIHPQHRGPVGRYFEK